MEDSINEVVVSNFIGRKCHFLYHICRVLSISLVYKYPVIVLLPSPPHITLRALAVCVLFYPPGMIMPPRHKVSALVVFLPRSTASNTALSSVTTSNIERENPVSLFYKNRAREVPFMLFLFFSSFLSKFQAVFFEFLFVLLFLGLHIFGWRNLRRVRGLSFLYRVDSTVYIVFLWNLWKRFYISICKSYFYSWE